MQSEVEAALAAWRKADRALGAGASGETDALKAEVKRHRAAFHRLSGFEMTEQLDALKTAESRRSVETPSTKPFHDAAKDEMQIAAAIWEHARASDEDIPGSENH